MKLNKLEQLEYLLSDNNPLNNNIFLRDEADVFFNWFNTNHLTYTTNSYIFIVNMILTKLKCNEEKFGHILYQYINNSGST